MTGSITSKGIIPDAARQAGVIVTDNGLLTQNPHLRYANMDVKGYGVVECTQEEMKVRFRAARAVDVPSSDVYDLRRFRVERGRAQVLDG